MKEELSELSRAEDILLGALGFADDAKLEQVHLKGEDLVLEGYFSSDGEKFKVTFDCERGHLEDWALRVLEQAGRVQSV